MHREPDRQEPPEHAIDPEIADLVPKYLERCRQDLEAIRRLLEQDQHDEIRQLAHRLAGSGTSYGFPEISRRGIEIEAHASAGNHAGILSESVLLDRYLNGLKLIAPE